MYGELISVRKKSISCIEPNTREINIIIENMALSLGLQALKSFAATIFIFIFLRY